MEDSHHPTHSRAWEFYSCLTPFSNSNDATSECVGIVTAKDMPLFKDNVFILQRLASFGPLKVQCSAPPPRQGHLVAPVAGLVGGAPRGPPFAVHDRAPSSNGKPITYHLQPGSCCCCKIRSCVFVECSCLAQFPISHFPHAEHMVSVFLGRLCFPISNPGFVLFSTSALHSSYPSTLFHPTPLPHPEEKNISLLNIGSPKGRSHDGRHQQPTRRSAVPHEGAQCRHLRYPPRALHTLHLQVANAGIAR